MWTLSTSATAFQTTDFNPQKRKKEVENVTHTILIVIEFDPKGASPLEVINTLNKLLEQNLTEGKISDYSICQPILNDDEEIEVIELVEKRKEETPNADNTTS
jgi:hypothetical protein